MSAGWAVVFLCAGAALDRYCVWRDRLHQEERLAERRRHPTGPAPSNVRLVYPDQEEDRG